MAVLAAACGAPAPLLNSERIAATYGNYAIEVVEANGNRRVSDLYSVEDGQRTTRTWAEVRFATPMDRALRTEHERVLAGGSIGEVFASRGWQVAKRNIRIDSELLDDSAQHIAARMRIAASRPIAVHEYAFVVARGGREIEYAVITERHHPDYLTEEELLAIYMLSGRE